MIERSPIEKRGPIERGEVHGIVTEGKAAESVLSDPYAQQRSLVNKAQQAVYLVFGTIETLIVIRFVLKLLGANREADFAEAIYRITSPLVSPFVGLFSNPRLGDGVLELESVLAVVIYALVSSALSMLIWIVFGEGRRGIRRSSRNVETSLR